MRSAIARRCTLPLLVAVCAVPAGAQSLSGNLTVDNAFTAYVSTTATTLGSPVATGNNWAATYSFGPTALTPGQNYWLQVVGTDFGAPAAFIGDFTLTGPFLFANGLQHIVTSNSSDWTVQTTSFAGPTTGIYDWGVNGVGPWGTHPAIDANAHWIWSEPTCGDCTRFFSTPILAQGVPSTVPEPSTWALLGTGLVGMGIAGRRRRRSV